MHVDRIRRRFIIRTVSSAAVLGLPLRAPAQPLRETARIINGYQGGGADIVSRKLAERLTGQFARTVIVENRTGAAGRVAVEAVRMSPPDGSTMLVTPTSVLTMYPHIYKDLPYNPFNDLSPVSLAATFTFALAVGPAVPNAVQTFHDFVAWCKANPASAQCANPGAGSFPHFMAMLVARDAKIDLIHVPYRGGSPAVQAVVGGQVSAVLTTEGTILAMEQAGRLRVLATTGARRSPFLAQVPTFRELGYAGLAQRECYALFMPAKTPAATIALAADGVRAALNDPEVREVWHKAALVPESSTPAELQQLLRSEYDFWAPVIRASGFTPES